MFGNLSLTGPLLEDPGQAVYAALFVAYLVETFIASFFTAALVAATHTVFHGKEPSVRGALAAAWQRKLPLLAWSLVAAIVGVFVLLALGLFFGLHEYTALPSAVVIGGVIVVGVVVPNLLVNHTRFGNG